MSLVFGPAALLVCGFSQRATYNQCLLMGAARLSCWLKGEFKEGGRNMGGTFLYIYSQQETGMLTKYDQKGPNCTQACFDSSY